MLLDAPALRTILNLDDEVYPDDMLDPIVESASRLVERMLVDGVDHSAHAWDREAVAHVANQIMQARSTPGGTMMGLDGQAITPHLLGRGLLARVESLLAPCRAVGSLAR